MYSENTQELINAAKMMLDKIKTGNYMYIAEAFVRLEEAVKVMEAQESQDQPYPPEYYDMLVLMEDMQ